MQCIQSPEKRSPGSFSGPAHISTRLRRWYPVSFRHFPAEQARIVALLVDRIDITTEGLDIRVRVDGLRGLAAEITNAHERRKKSAIFLNLSVMKCGGQFMLVFSRRADQEDDEFHFEELNVIPNGWLDGFTAEEERASAYVEAL